MRQRSALNDGWSKLLQGWKERGYQKTEGAEDKDEEEEQERKEKRIQVKTR